MKHDTIVQSLCTPLICGLGEECLVNKEECLVNNEECLVKNEECLVNKEECLVNNEEIHTIIEGAVCHSYAKTEYVLFAYMMGRKKTFC